MTQISSQLAKYVEEYFKARNLKIPTFFEAMAWMQTEVGETYEVWLAKFNFARNNPEAHPPFSEEKLAEELGDVLLMIMVAGLTQGVNPLWAMLRKMSKHIKIEGFEEAQDD